MTKKCPTCGCTEIWDADCPECDGGLDDCLACEGSGYLEGHSECSECGTIDADHTFDALEDE